MSNNTTLTSNDNMYQDDRRRNPGLRAAAEEVDPHQRQGHTPLFDCGQQCVWSADALYPSTST